MDELEDIELSLFQEEEEDDKDWHDWQGRYLCQK